MSINSIGTQVNYESYNSYSTTSSLSEETKRKLLALGIDPKTVTSEAQAQILIENAVKIQKTQNLTPSVKCECSSSNELMTRAKKLASKIGIVTNSSMTLEEMLKLISDKIEKDHLTQYKTEAQNLGCDINNLTSHENSMYAAMNYSANLNKMMLGL